MFSDLIDNLINSTLQVGIPAFAPELALSGTIIVLLLLRLFSVDRYLPVPIVATVGAAVALVMAIGDIEQLLDGSSFTFFGDMLRQDLFSGFFRVFLALFLILTIALTMLTGIPDTEDAPDFYALIFGATIGMMIMASANSLLMLFLGVEMASVPSYVMVGFLKGRKPSSEAALKYVVYGAGAAGVMLYGISLIAGVLGTGDMSLLAERLQVVAGGESAGLADPEVRTVALGVMLVMVGLAFKLSLVPFHFWCPDAFEGASAEVGGFLSVASKAGAFALLVRFCVSLSGVPATASLMTAFGVGLGFIAIVTMTLGNLAAYTQNNLKRLFAYSTIAHAGYMVMAVAAMLIMLNSDKAVAYTETLDLCLGGLLYYLAVYLFMNLGCFAVVALVRNHTFNEDIDSFKGLSAQSPALSICMVLCIASLVGIPPLGGFLAKFMIFGVVYKAGDLHWSMYVVLASAGLNTIFSLFYYARILRAMWLDERPESVPDVRLQGWDSGYVVVLGLMVVLLGGVWWQLADGLNSISSQAGSAVLSAIGG